MSPTQQRAYATRTYYRAMQRVYEDIERDMEELLISAPAGEKRWRHGSAPSTSTCPRQPRGV
jgi:hypothetical protein